MVDSVEQVSDDIQGWKMSTGKISPNPPGSNASPAKGGKKDTGYVQKKTVPDKTIKYQPGVSTVHKNLAKRAIGHMKTALSASIQKAITAKYTISSGNMKKVQYLRGLIKAAAKKSKKRVSAKAEKAPDSGFIKFAEKTAKKLASKGDPGKKKTKKKKHKKVTRADRRYKRKFGHSKTEDEGDTAVMSNKASTFNAVDRKIDKSQAMDSVKKDQVFGAADVHKIKVKK